MKVLVCTDIHEEKGNISSLQIMHADLLHATEYSLNIQIQLKWLVI